jgi:hypothetical protein
MAAIDRDVWKAAQGGSLPLVRALVEEDRRRATLVDEVGVALSRMKGRWLSHLHLGAQDGRQPLHWAATRGATDVIEYLLQQPGVAEAVDAPDEVRRAPYLHPIPSWLMVSDCPRRCSRRGPRS